MRFTSPNLTRVDKLELLQRWVIVQSILYYELDYSLVPDYMYDANCTQLVRGMEKSPKSLKKTQYYYCMHDFDGSTGFDLYARLNKKDKEYLTGIAHYLKRTLTEVSPLPEPKIVLMQDPVITE